MPKFHLEPAIKLVDRVSEVDAFPLGQKLSQLRLLLQAEVIPDKVSVDAVSPPLFGVVQDVRGCATKMKKTLITTAPIFSSEKDISAVTHPPLSSVHTSFSQ